MNDLFPFSFDGVGAGIALWFAQATLLCVVVVVLARATERWSATLAHRLWTVGLVGIVLLPVLGLVLPAVPIPIETALIKSGSPGATETVDSDEMDDTPTRSSESLAPAQPEPNAFVPTPTADGSEAIAQAEYPDRGVSEDAVSEDETKFRSVEPERRSVPTVAAQLSDASTASESSGAASSSRSNFDPLPLALTVWLAIACCFLVRLAFSFRRLRRFIAACEPAPDSIQQSAFQLAKTLQVGPAFRMLVAAPKTMPLACWFGRWFVVVPREFESWPQPLQEVVLTHELGHIARRDSWTDLLAQTVCRIGWPNPLLWLARFRVRHLRERACDEWVLSSGRVSAEDYARSLLDVITRSQSAAPGLASTMARQRDLESRVRTLISRRVLAWAQRPAAGVVSALCVLLLTGVIAAAQVVAVPANSSSDQDGDADAKAAADARDDVDTGADVAPNVVRTREPVPADGPKLNVHGQVTGLDGNPLPGATVVLRAKIGGQQYGHGFTHNRDLLARTTTDRAGRFRLLGIGIPPRMSDTINSLMRGSGGVELFVWARDSAMAWQEIPKFDNPEPIDITLRNEVPVRGIVTDPNGKPVSDARVWVGGITPARESTGNILRNPGEVEFSLSELTDSFAVRTDDRGRFRMKHLPADHRLTLIITTGEFAHKAVVVDTDPNSTLTEFKFGQRSTIPVHKTSSVIRLERQPGVRVKVVDHNGRPVKAGLVEAVRNRYFVGMRSVDETGTATLAVRGSGECEVSFSADPLDPRPGGSAKVEIPEQGIADVTIRLPEPRWLTGQVVDEQTKRPIAGAGVSYSNWIDGAPPKRSTASVGFTDADGRFRLPVLPGTGHLQFRHQVHGYLAPILSNSAKREFHRIPVEIPETGDVPAVELKLTRGLILRGRVVHVDGKPAAGVTVRAENTQDVYRKGAATTDPEGRFEIAGLSPHVPTAVSVVGESGALQRAIPGDVDHPWDQTRVVQLDLKLQAGVTLFGRIMRDGEPQAGVPMKLWLSLPQQINRYSVAHEFRTNEKGEYRVTGIRRGQGYRFELATKDGATAPGWPHQMPYIQIIRQDEKRKEIKLPDAVLIGRGQTLQGIVVDPDGKPVPGVSVSASIAGGPSLARPRTGPPPWTKTNDEGKFTLSQLPDRPIELMAYIANPKGGRIRFPAKASPKRDQRDIRIIYDPSLQDDVEDLDADPDEASR